MPFIICPSCEHRVPVAENAANKRVMCSKCGEILLVPRSAFDHEDSHDAADDLAGEASPPMWRKVLRGMFESLADSKNLGLVVLGMGLLSFLLLCIPTAGFHLGLFLSGLGLLLGVGGTMRCVLGKRRGVGYLLGGCGACFLALLLILLPRLSS
jgi:hypothetical protein